MRIYWYTYNVKSISKNSPVFHQVNCIESRDGTLDLRQAEAIGKYKPDIIILEYPTEGSVPEFPLNDYLPTEKPADLVAERTKEFSEKILKANPWVAADTIMWREVVKAWNQGKQIYAYPTDGPYELISEWREVWDHMYPQAIHNWVWWVPIYLRERLMANHISWILHKHAEINKPVINVYLQSFHWKHVQFLLSDPTKNEIWNYYFGKFKSEISQKEMPITLKRLNPVFYKYWQKYSDF